MALTEPDVARSPGLDGREADGDRRRLHLQVRGLVQGVGFRPHVYVLATDLLLSGSVANTFDGVEIEVEGPADAVADFARRVVSAAPPLAAIEDVRLDERPTVGGTGFTIEHSRPADGTGVRTLASPDVATCADCLRELADPADRRYRHPFISCTNCGPRLTVITGLPYDRPRTTMAGFPLCDACRREYTDPADRRFHAADHRLPRLRPDARAARARRRARRGGGGPEGSAPAAGGGRDPRREGSGWLPPGVRCGRRARGRRAAPAQAPRRQALRGDGSRSRDRPGVRRPRCRGGAVAHRAAAADRATPPSGAGVAGAVRGSRVRRYRVVPAVHARACAALRARRRRARRAGTARPGADVGQPRRRTDRDGRRRRAGPARAARRRLAAPRPADPRPLRRLRGPRRGRARSWRSAVPAATRRCRPRCRSPCRPRWPSAPT